METSTIAHQEQIQICVRVLPKFSSRLDTLKSTKVYYVFLYGIYFTHKQITIASIY
jgi:hypothetical protein